MEEITVMFMPGEDMWKNLINNMKAEDLPDSGTGPPQMETESKKVLDGESPVLLQKIVTEIYVYTSAEGEQIWYGAKSFQDVQVLGKMRFSEALSFIEKASKRRRRK